jgi:peptidyl-prolyl cis-trans isomerase C/peptidyl-prolyl cis-trans isomerase SurA
MAASLVTKSRAAVYSQVVQPSYGHALWRYSAMKKTVSAFIVPMALILVACGGGEPAEETAGTDDTETTTETVEPVEETPLDMITASHILVSWDTCGLEGVTRTQDEARTLIDEIEAGIAAGDVSFSDAAIEHSDCPSGVDGGNLGAFGRGAMVPPFDEAAFALQPGEISGVVETQFGYHLIQRTE